MIKLLKVTTVPNIENVSVFVPGTIVAIGGAPVTQNFSDKIGADVYSPDPQGIIDYLKKV